MDRRNLTGLDKATLAIGCFGTGLTLGYVAGHAYHDKEARDMFRGLYEMLVSASGLNESFPTSDVDDEDSTIINTNFGGNNDVHPGEHINLDGNSDSAMSNDAGSQDPERTV